MEGTTSRKLALDFRTPEGVKINVSVPHAADGLDSETVYNAMEAMVDANVLIDANGTGAETPYGAKIIETTTQELF